MAPNFAPHSERASQRTAALMLTVISIGGCHPEWQVRGDPHLTSCSIPLDSGLESLNAAVAASVILYEAVRQRASAQHCSAPPATTSD